MPAAEPTESAWLLAQSAKNAHRFQTTLWTTVVAAGQESSPDGQAALARLCQIYWPPVYTYIRKRSPSPEQAEDLTQGFFARFLERNYINRVDRNRGRFRSFLLASVENFLCDEYDRATSLKRGGSQPPVLLDITLVDEEKELAVSLTPAQAFEKRWARSLLDQVTAQLACECRANGRLLLFEQLQSHIWDEADSIPYELLARKLDMSHVHLRVAVHRLRQRYREILREEIAQTVSRPDEIENEIRYLLQVVSS